MAHEYGQVWSEEFNMEIRSDNPKRLKDSQADVFTFLLTIISARQVVLVPANIALQGGFLHIRNSIKSAGRSTWFCGELSKSIRALRTIPTRQRIELLRRLYTRELLSDKDNQGLDHAIDDTLHPSETLQFLLTRIHERFKVASEKGNWPARVSFSGEFSPILLVQENPVTSRILVKVNLNGMHELRRHAIDYFRKHTG